jgi:O-antigen/teichoic acid export membrane protein
MTGHERIAARILWQTATLNIAMNAVLIPLFGMAGAATASAVSLVVWNAALYRQVRQRLSISSTAFIASSE